MKRLLLVLAIATTQVLAQPKLEVIGGVKLDLGEIIRGTVVKREVTIKNGGTEALSIESVRPSCGCTGTLVTSDTIAPGKTGTIVITFNSKNFNGPIAKSITITSNSANEPRSVVEFTGVVKEEVSVNPAQFWFRNAEVGMKSSAMITVENKGTDSLSLTGFSTTLEGFALKLPGTPIPPGASTQIEAEYVPKEPRSVLSDGVILKTSNPLQSEVYIYIYGTVKEFKFQ
jgi:Protein of unknown function (DUF1573)/HYDIN/CFA65/VesB-like, Ig-like domain